VTTIEVREISPADFSSFEAGSHGLGHDRAAWLLGFRSDVSLRDAVFDAGSYLYFEREVLAAMYNAGRRAANAWLASGPRTDHLEEHAAGAAA